MTVNHLDVNQNVISSIAQTILNTFSPDQNFRKTAESTLKSSEKSANFCVILLEIVRSPNLELNVRVAAAVSLKNFVKSNWPIKDQEVDIFPSPEERDVIKKNIVNIMLSSPLNVQKQLSEAIAVIGKQDFPSQWTSLLDEMVNRLNEGSMEVIAGVLRTAASIFEKYSYEMKSQKLWEEIKYVLDNFAKPFTQLATSTAGLASTSTDPKVMKFVYDSLVQISKIFYYLNYQDLPEFFEDNMQTWMTHFHTLLTTTSPVASGLFETPSSNDEPTVLEELRSQICDNIGLYAHRYEEEFSPYMKQFVTAVWNMLLSSGPDLKYDMLVSTGIQFLASVADRKQYQSLFQDSEILSSICQKIIIPNIRLRPVDIQMFEMNPEEYIRQDLEGSDLETRRRAACDLVKGLSRYFEAEITKIFGSYVNVMLEEYNSNPQQNWLSKDAAIYLVTSLAAKAKTAKHGITQTNQLVDLNQFCVTHIIPELSKASTNQQAVNETPIIKSTCIKYILTFRNQLSVDLIRSSVDPLITLLQAESQVTHSYAAAALEKLFMLKNLNDPNNASVGVITKEALSPIGQTLLSNLFTCFQRDGSQENEYVMKCVMRSFSTLNETAIPLFASILPVLTGKLQTAAKNPTNPHFNHYLFESIAISIRIVCDVQPEAASNFESILFPVFHEIMQQDVQEFVPYVFQLLSLLLELRGRQGGEGGQVQLPPSHMELFQFLLMPVLWERSTYATTLTRLMCAYIRVGHAQIIAADKVQSVMGIFQKLISSRNMDHEGFHLIETIFTSFPPQVVLQYQKPIFTLLFQRLTSMKTTKFIKSFIVFLCVYILKFGGNPLIQIIDSIQANMFAMVCQRIFVLEMAKVVSLKEKMVMLQGVLCLLTKCDAIYQPNGAYTSQWAPILTTLVQCFETTQDEAFGGHPVRSGGAATDDISNDERFIEVEDTGSSSAGGGGFSQLVFVGREDRYGAVLNMKELIKESHGVHIMNSLKVMEGSNLARLGVNLDGNVKQVINTYCQRMSTPPIFHM